MKQRDHVELLLAITPMGLSLTLVGRKVESSFGRQSVGTVPVDRITAQVIFKLAEIVLMREKKNAQYMADRVFKEAARVDISVKGKRRRLKFAPSGPVMPDYLRVLVREMYGLTKW
jgi:hypothetical protein